MNDVMLFAQQSLGKLLLARTETVTTQLQNWDADAFLTTPEADAVEELVTDGSVACPVLQRDEAWLLPPSEVTQIWQGFQGPVERRVPQLILVVPFTGEREVFLLTAQTYGMKKPRVVKLDSDELHLAVENPDPDSAKVRAHLDAQIDGIERQLEWSRQQIDEHNARIRREVPGIVARRRQQLLTIRRTQAGIGYPIRRRPDADTHAVPVRRRTLRPHRPRPSASTFQPEPVLLENDYRDALAVLRNARNALERTPGLAAKLGEEEIRNNLLVSLNAQFQGAAAGELFNGAGKTDILIRVEDRNVFIGECKIWDGVASLHEALDQIFRYLVWRDTKAAILLFIRNRDVTAVIAKAVAAIEQHPHYKRRGPENGDDQIDFVMHATGDPQREIHLALLPFALPGPVSTPSATT